MDRMSRDTLTGLYDRKAYLLAASDYMSSVITPTRGAACLFYDITGMKTYNDRYGYEAGDHLLKQMAAILTELYPDAVVARLEADHFAVVVSDENLVERLERSLQAFDGQGRSQRVRVGVCLIESADIDAVLVIDRAKLASDSLRSDPKRRYAFYDSAFDKQIRIRRHVVNAIDQALEEGWIKVYFQPVIRTLTHGLCGLEALARWDDPQFGMLSPIDFVGPLEDALLIYKLDSYVVRHVCELYRTRTDAGKPTVPISVNLSRLDFVACDIHEVIDEAVRTYDVPRDMLNIEITESTFIKDADIITLAMERFHERGHDVWMDDFGSGYSSLNVLKDYSFDELKLDMAFLSSFTETSRAIVSSTVSMAKRIGIHTLAEGVETREQFEFLRSVGCEKTQGYYFGMPLPIDECMSLVRIHGLQVETPPWRRYFDTIGTIDFFTKEPLTLIEDDGIEFHVLYVNEAAEKTLKLLGVHELDRETPTPAFMRSALAHRLRQELKQPLEPGEESDLTYFGNGQHARLKLVGLARNGLNHAYQLTLEGLTYAKSEENLRLISAAQVLCGTCHDLQFINLKNDTTTPVVGVDSLMFDRVTHGLERAMRTYAQQELYPLDIKRFLSFMDFDTLEERLAAAEGTYLSDCFRSLTEIGDYVWRIYTISPLQDGTTDLVLYSKDVRCETPVRFVLPHEQATHEDVETLSRMNVLDLLHRIYDDMDNPVALANVETHELVYMNPCAQRTYGVNEDALGTQPCYRVLRGEDIACVSCREQLLSGKRHAAQSSFNSKLNCYFNHKDTLLTLGDATMRLEFSYDVSHEQQGLFELAETDSLTGLLNRRGCDRTMTKMLREDPKSMHALIAFDVNDFKLFNDLYGHAAGDALLISVAHELNEVFGEECAVGRNGGDEFLALVPHTTYKDAAAVIESFSQRPHLFSYGGNTYRYSIAAGYALYPTQADNFVELCRMADRALYHVKTNPGTWVCYSPEMEFENRTILGFNLKDIALGMPGAILVYKADGGEEILYANDELVKMFECDDMEDFLAHVGNSFKTLVHPGDIDRVEESIWNQVTTNDENLDYVDYRIITKNGKVKDIWDAGRLVESSYYGNVFYVYMYDKGTWEEVIKNR